MIDKEKEVEEAIQKAKEVETTNETGLTDDQLDAAAGGLVVDEN